MGFPRVKPSKVVSYIDHNVNQTELRETPTTIGTSRPRRSATAPGSPSPATASATRCTSRPSARPRSSSSAPTAHTPLCGSTGMLGTGRLDIAVAMCAAAPAARSSSARGTFRRQRRSATSSSLRRLGHRWPPALRPGRRHLVAVEGRGGRSLDRRARTWTTPSGRWSSMRSRCMYTGNCGNFSAVGPFAVEEGLVQAAVDRATDRHQHPEAHRGALGGRGRRGRGGW